MLRVVTIILIILIQFAACSRNGNSILPDPVENDTSAMLTSGQSDDTGTRVDDLNLWGAYEIVWNVESGSAALTDRTAELALRHYKVSYFLTEPRCTDCIDVKLVKNDPDLGTGTFDVTLTNPTSLKGYDVRGMLRNAKTTNLTLLNADGYTSLFEHPDFVSPAPFKTYATGYPDYRFDPFTSNTETFELKTSPGTKLVTFNFLVTAGHPAPAGDVSYIGAFQQYGQLKPGGGSATVSFDIVDLQDDIGGVLLHAGPIGGGDIWMTPSGDRFEATIVNSVADPGIYSLQVEAFSPNLQNAVTSNYFRAVVFDERDSWRADLLTLVNQDRIDNGLGTLELDPLLNTAAQAHAQDMADKQYFSHINLDDWTPWQRMRYYGIEFSSAGENIATGFDSPSTVEVAWMDSPGHRANILGGSFNKIGLGIAPCEPGDKYYPGYYWVQTFTN